MLEQPNNFFNPWDLERQTCTPCDVKPTSFLPYRRHSLAQELMVSRNQDEEQDPSSSNFVDLFDSFWKGGQQKQYPESLSLFSPSTTTMAPPSLIQSTQDGSKRPFRRFSLAPIAYETTQDHINALSSVPEESFQAYRRHSLAGPLISSAGSPPIHNPATRSYGTIGNNTSTRMNDTWSAAGSDKDTRLLNNVLSPLLDQAQKSWCMVEFKAGRAEIYYSPQSLRQDAWVIVEADRGQDLGRIVAKDLTWDQAQLLSTDDPSPKQICRLATGSEITLLVTKRQDEQKALLICQTKCKQRDLLMDIVDAEYQWDRRKLTFYFVADRRIDFRELVRDLFKIYKTRIWMCSVNSMATKVMTSSS